MVIGLIVARAGSKGIINKNKILINNKPMIDYTFDAVSKSVKLDKIILSTDDLDIIDLAKTRNLKHIHKRPKELSKDNSNIIDLIRHLFEQNWFNLNDVIVLLQPTSPLRDFAHIDEAIIKFHANSYKSLVSITELEHSSHPEKLMIMSDGVLIGQKEVKNRQSMLNKYYKRNGAIYISTTEEILINNSFISQLTGFYLMNKLDSIDIDDKYDLYFVKKLMA